MPVSRMLRGGGDVEPLDDNLKQLMKERQEETPDEAAYSHRFEGETQLNITSQDVKFLKSLKISIDEKEVS